VLPVRSFAPLTPRSRLLSLEAGAGEFAFHAGQAVWIGRPGLDERKPYSIASAPADLARGQALEFLVGLEDDGEAGPHLAGIGPGGLVEVEGPLGGFDLPPSAPNAPVLLVAGGTGIAPLRSMWRELLAHDRPPPIAVIYSARTAEQLVFVEELRALERAGGLALTLTVTGADPSWGGTMGRVSTEMLAARVPAPAVTRCAICGPAAFVAHVGHVLTRLGVPLAHISTERW
jgi:ferredoxin-NADP reductase